MSAFQINTNLSAQFTRRQLGDSQKRLAQAQERLSSGLKINSAADDASGLTITQGMESQIRGYNMASQNAQDGISVIQTAEGGYKGIGNAIQRMRELAVRSANDTFEQESRQAIQSEADQLVKEIRRTAQQTQFNGMQVLQTEDSRVTDSLVPDIDFDRDENLSGDPGAWKDILDGIKNGEKVTLRYSFMESGVANPEGSNPTEEINDSNLGGITEAQFKDSIRKAADFWEKHFNKIYGRGSDFELEIENLGDETGSEDHTSSAKNIGQDNHGEFRIGLTDIDGAGGTLGKGYFSTGPGSPPDDSTMQGGLGNPISQAGNVYFDTDETWEEANANGGNTDVGAVAAHELGHGLGFRHIENIDGAEDALMWDSIAPTESLADKSQSDLDIAQTENVYGISEQVFETDEVIGGNGRAQFQLGPQEGQNIEQVFQDAMPSTLGLNNLDFTTTEGANEAISKLDDALKLVNRRRSKLGATQNRLETSINQQEVTGENLSAARSRIRDADMAEESVNSTRENILSQAGTSMLSQANQTPQQALQLL